LSSVVRGSLGGSDITLQLAYLLLETIDVRLQWLEVLSAGEREDRSGRRQLHYDCLIHSNPLIADHENRIEPLAPADFAGPHLTKFVSQMQ